MEQDQQSVITQIRSIKKRQITEEETLQSPPIQREKSFEGGDETEINQTRTQKASGYSSFSILLSRAQSIFHIDIQSDEEDELIMTRQLPSENPQSNAIMQRLKEDENNKQKKQQLAPKKPEISPVRNQLSGKNVQLFRKKKGLLKNGGRTSDSWNTWVNSVFELDGEKLGFKEVIHPFSKLTKLKIIPGSCRTIKIETIDGEECLFNFRDNSQVYHVPLCFYAFSKILINKLTHSHRVTNLKMNPPKQESCFHTKWEKNKHCNSQLMLNSYIFGTIFKKSQHKGIWNPRYVVITQQGLFSYRDCNKKESHSFFIDKASVKYIWTRFQMLQEGFVIVKIKHSVCRQTEFAIPVVEFDRKGGKNWLFEFYRMLNKG